MSKRTSLVALLIGLIVVILLTSCRSQPGTFWTDPAEWELEWHPANPPREGLNCWIAVHSEYGGDEATGYGFVYCEPIESEG